MNFNQLSPAEQLMALGVKSKPKKFGQVVQQEVKRQYKESADQSTFAGYLKKYHQDVLFQTTRIEGQKEFWEQNQIKKQNSNRGFPDTNIFLACGGYNGLMIENKRMGTELFQKRDLSRFSSVHLAEQYDCHQKLIQAGYAVYFAIGVEQAVKIFEQYRLGTPLPFLNVDKFILYDYYK